MEARESQAVFLVPGFFLITMAKFSLMVSLAVLGTLAIAPKAGAVSIVADPIKASSYDAALCSKFAGAAELDRAFECMKVKGEITEKWVAESRIGGPSTWEVGISKADSSGVVSMAKDALGKDLNKHLEWQNGTQYQFSLNFNAATSEVVYEVGGQKLSWFANNGSVTDLLVRTRGGLQSGAKDGSSSSIDLLNLSIVNGGKTKTWAAQSSSIADAVDGKTSAAIADIDYLRIADLKGNFTLTGTSVFKWNGVGTRPTNSNLAYQIKGVTMSPYVTSKVPEPGTLGALAIGGLVMGYRKRKAQGKA